MPECEFVFDLELPQDFKPVNADGEVESFELLSISKVCALLSNSGDVCTRAANVIFKGTNTEAV